MKVEQIKVKSLISLQVSVDFYQRLQDLAVYLSNTASPEVLKEVIDKVSTNQELDEFQTSLETIWILIKTLENNAKEQQLIEEVELPNINQ
jgi:predicted DNA-binding protein